ncbi:MAG: fatty acid desaturase [Paracoccaceae bacterium]
MMRTDRWAAVEWPTIGLIAAVHLLWAILTIWLAGASVVLAVGILVPVIALFSSLQHEVLHGHPFRSRRLNEALVFLPFTLFVPYGRFRDLHLAHHRDEFLTDPYDDPESNYLDPAVWQRLPGVVRAVLRLNNKLAGRILIGPAISTLALLRTDAAAIRSGDRTVRDAWLLHLAGLVALVLWLALLSPLSVPAYALAAYLAYGVLKIRTFLEHRAHERARGRSVVIEDRGPLAFLFLNNNLHALHHAAPQISWYRLPAAYRDRREEVLRRNDGYRFASYAEVFRAYFLRAKDPVPHPAYPLRPAVNETDGDSVDPSHPAV